MDTNVRFRLCLYTKVWALTVLLILTLSIDDLTHKLWPQGNMPTSLLHHHTLPERCRRWRGDQNQIWSRLFFPCFSRSISSCTVEWWSVSSASPSGYIWNQFRFFKYRGLDDNTEEKLGLDPHIDRHSHAILCRNDVVDGLEIKTKDGEEWIKAKPSQDYSFLVIAGASLHVKISFLESQVSSFRFMFLITND
ncbi:putative inactive 2-oxoglutarate-dependent dioxygenase AOP2 [Cardamine amara subsp. amara]|uniref:Inactive 2-oxoglutarate-dependent dioxygenase AOP2 n=1 Tax=Cardamine amara subsp. amara TaxID=228776 RepID=A0ABD1AGW8_CARAN